MEGDGGVLFARRQAGKESYLQTDIGTNPQHLTPEGAAACLCASPAPRESFHFSERDTTTTSSVITADAHIVARDAPGARVPKAKLQLPRR